MLYRSQWTQGAHRLIVLMLMLITVLVILGIPATAAPRTQIANTSTVSPEQKVMMCALENCFSAMAQQAESGVVSITAVQGQAPSLSDSADKPAKRPSGVKPTPADRRKRPGAVDSPGSTPTRPGTSVVASGSGAIVRRQGDIFYILTNYHVVEDAYRVTVHINDGTQLKGTVVGIDPVTDLAVVSVSSPALSDGNILPLADSNAVKVGSWALALGSPYGFDHTLTVGVVSALHRVLEQDDDMYPDLIQTDAAINKGNSGGPLLNVEGKVIGINSVIASPTGSFIGLGFAIPINTAKAVLDQLIQNGRVVRGWLGVSIQELTPVLQEFYGTRNGVVVSSVDDKGPAAKAGMQSEDIVVKVGETQISTVDQFQRIVSSAAPGTVVPVGIMRDGKPIPMSMTVGISPSTPIARPSPPPGAKDNIGIKVMSISSELAAGMGLKSTKGVVVVDVAPGTSADDSGLEPGDVVMTFNGLSIDSESQFANVLKDIRPGSIVVLKVMRKGDTHVVGFRWE